MWEAQIDLDALKQNKTQRYKVEWMAKGEWILGEFRACKCVQNMLYEILKEF